VPKYKSKAKTSVLSKLKDKGAPAPGEWDGEMDEEGSMKKKKKKDDDDEFTKARRPIKIAGTN